MAELIEPRPDIVFTTATHGKDGAKEHVVAQFAERGAKLTPFGMHVVAIRANPWFPNDVPECVQVNGPDSRRCTLERSKALAGKSPFSNIPADPRIHFIDVTDHLCPGGRCPVVVGNIVMYSDRHHLTNTLVRTSIPYLSRTLIPIMTQFGKQETLLGNYTVGVLSGTETIVQMWRNRFHPSEMRRIDGRHGRGVD